MKCSNNGKRVTLAARQRIGGVGLFIAIHMLGAACDELTVVEAPITSGFAIGIKCRSGLTVSLLSDSTSCGMSVGEVDTIRATVAVDGASLTGLQVSWVSLDESAVSIRTMDQVFDETVLDTLPLSDVLGLSLRAEVVALRRGDHSVRLVVDSAGAFTNAVQSHSIFLITVDERWGSVAAGGGHTCALTFRDVQDVYGERYTASIRGGGEAFCWGDGPDGALGTGSFGERRPFPVLSDDGFKTIASGRGHTCAVDLNDLVSCWGGNERGELGTGNGLDQFRPRELALGIPFGTLALGNQFSCGVPISLGNDSESISTVCWGRNVEGQLGCDDGSAGEPCEDLALEDKGDLAVPSEDVKSAGGDIFFSTVAAGARHACGLELVAGLAWCWGDNSMGQLGVSNLPVCQKKGSSPTDTISFDCARLAVRVEGPAGGEPMEFMSVAAGGEFTCADTAAAIYCWGRNDKGQLGNGSFVDSGEPVLVTGALGEGGVSILTAGGAHACALTPNGVAFCWGSNTDGQLGDGTTSASAQPVKVMGDLEFVGLSAGRNHTCGVVHHPIAMVAPGGAIYCWGSNQPLEMGGISGKLGNGMTENSRVPVRIAEPGSS